jgi:hypothetical protein
MAFYGAVTWTLRQVDQNYLESLEMWCWKRMEKISWTDDVKNSGLRRTNEERNILYVIKRRKVAVKLQPCQSQLTLYARNIPNAVCLAPPEDEQVMLEICSGL